MTEWDGDRGLCLRADVHILYIIHYEWNYTVSAGADWSETYSVENQQTDGEQPNSWLHKCLPLAGLNLRQLSFLHENAQHEVLSMSVRLLLFVLIKTGLLKVFSGYHDALC